ncbi:MAG TPA: hypothetical protein VFI84_02900 [Candidatus Saccharimonadales bacterium]|nr:hypothetical protein [Candidatus Saccharimonadales bacterium]
MQPDEPTDEERQQELPQDNGTPFQPAPPSPDPTGSSDPVVQAGSDSTLDDTHPATDSGIQPEEQYDEGVAGAAEAQEPNAGNATASFSPPADGMQPEEGGAPKPDDGTNPTGTDEEDIVVG